MRMRPLVLVPLIAILLSGCATSGTVGEGGGDPISSSSSTVTPTPTPTPTPEPTPEPTALGWSSQRAWDACYSAHLAEFPLTEGSTIDPFDDSDVTWDPVLDGYVVHLTGQVVENGTPVDATRVCLVQGVPDAPQVTVNPVME